jgi:virginiamycin B lyase
LPVIHSGAFPNNDRKERAMLIASLWQQFLRFKQQKARSAPLFQPFLEALEDRCVPSLTVNQFPVGDYPGPITPGKNGTLWVGGIASFSEVNLATHKITQFMAPGLTNGPQGLTLGPDGNLWFTENNGKIGEFNVTTHVAREFTIESSFLADVTQIATVPDGNIWFTEQGDDKVGEINPTSHAFLEFTLPTPDAGPYGITVGPDGNLWFTEVYADQIGMIDPHTHAIQEFAIPTRDQTPIGITVGPDRNIWFDENNGVGAINPRTHAIQEFAVSTTNTPMLGIAASSNGNVWFTERSGVVGEINPKTHAIQQFQIASYSGDTYSIVNAADGNLWFTEPDFPPQAKIAEIVLNPHSPTPHSGHTRGGST